MLNHSEYGMDQKIGMEIYWIMPRSRLYILAATICTILLITKTQNTCFGLLIVAIGVPVYYVKKYFAKPE